MLFPLHLIRSIRVAALRCGIWLLVMGALFQEEKADAGCGDYVVTVRLTSGVIASSHTRTPLQVSHSRRGKELLPRSTDDKLPCGSPVCRGIPAGIPEPLSDSFLIQTDHRDRAVMTAQPCDAVNDGRFLRPQFIVPATRFRPRDIFEPPRRMC